MKLGDNDLGFRLSFGQDGFTQDSIPFVQQKLEESARYIEFAAGYSTDLYDASLSIELPSASSEEGNLKDEASGTMLNLKGRYFYDYTSKMKIVPVVQLGYGLGSQKTDQGGGAPQIETDVSQLYFNLGVGLNYEISENSMLILAIDPFGYMSYTTDEKVDTVSTETTRKTTTLPRLYIGAETSIRPWITARIGAYREYNSMTTEIKPSAGDKYEVTSQSSPYNVSFGLGMNFANFLIDLEINDGILFEGPNFISGTFRDFSNRVSISYVFGNNERSK
jgi:hypothetical protein